MGCMRINTPHICRIFEKYFHDICVIFVGLPYLYSLYVNRVLIGRMRIKRPHNHRKLMLTKEGED